ncbi:hypothetical protein VTN49DRAFT_668 [Thermomyces lanuginosus]|uniref:uncharacterized protein n=1 Tax=Thermomyces lanuginosus TaxID=5541 RepID=UPI003743A0CA
MAPIPEEQTPGYVTSLAFSSPAGGRSILAVGRVSGTVYLWSTFEPEVRFMMTCPCPVTCVAFKESTTRRRSRRAPGIYLPVEDLAVGDNDGYVWYFSVEWPDGDLEEPWGLTLTLLAKIAAHKLQICGLAWSPDGKYLATGGNDNCCNVFDLDEILACFNDEPSVRGPWTTVSPLGSPNALSRQTVTSRLRDYLHRFRGSASSAPVSRVPSAESSTQSVETPVAETHSLLVTDNPAIIPKGCQKHRFVHCAAVKAIAFAPWQPTLLATGGGMNDRAVHFYHAPSGSCLATIDVQAQVTSLIWSRTRKEIAVILGFAQPQHPYRIAVFAWPSCEQVAAIPWDLDPEGLTDFDPAYRADCGRALFAIRHPARPRRYQTPSNSGYSSGEDDILTPIGRLSKRTGSRSMSATSSETGTCRRHPTKAKKGKQRPVRVEEDWSIAVAASDETVRIYHVWDDSRKTVVCGSGLLGYSAILETAEGIEDPGREVIR